MTLRNTKAVLDGRPGYWACQIKPLPLVVHAGNDAALVTVVTPETVASGDVVLVEQVLRRDIDRNSCQCRIETAQVVVHGRVVHGV
ncbi:hypothetical protein D3C85_1707350 [compost metagenome]